jgi:hypothetical protein
LFPQGGTQKMRSGASFDADQRARQVRGIGQQLRTGKLLAHQNLVALSQSNHVKSRLAQIDTNGCDVHVMILLM